MVLSVCVGCGLGGVNLLIPQDGTAGVAHIAFNFGLVPFSLALLCWPLTAYRTVFWVTGLGCLFENLVFLIKWHAIFLLGGTWMLFPMMWLINASVVSGVVWARRTYFPVFPDGCCQRCGYDLRGSKVRCPECGTPFETAELKADH